MFQLGYTALVIQEVTEYEGVRRAGLDAGRSDFTLLDCPVLLFRQPHPTIDTLYTKGTFLHNTPGPYSNIGVKLVP